MAYLYFNIGLSLFYPTLEPRSNIQSLPQKFTVYGLNERKYGFYWMGAQHTMSEIHFVKYCGNAKILLVR